MEDNPFGAFWGMIHGDSDGRANPPWLIGEVITIVPLVIQSGEQNLTGTDLLINIQLLEHNRDMTQTAIHGNLVGVPNVDIANGTVYSKAKHHTLLEPGDQVLLLPSDDMQHFVVMCKLAKATT